MIHILLEVAGGFALFAAGCVYGSFNTPSVNKAIASLQAYEAQAAATLAKITDHKAS